MRTEFSTGNCPLQYVLRMSCLRRKKLFRCVEGPLQQIRFISLRAYSQMRFRSSRLCGKAPVPMRWYLPLGPKEIFRRVSMPRCAAQIFKQFGLAGRS